MKLLAFGLYFADVQTFNVRGGMELKQYWQIIWKRAWIPALLLIVVAAASLLTGQTPAPTYSTTMRFTVGVKPQEVSDQYTYDSY